MHQNMLILEQMAHIELVIFFDEVTDIYDLRTEVDWHLSKALNVVLWLEITS